MLIADGLTSLTSAAMVPWPWWGSAAAQHLFREPQRKSNILPYPMTLSVTSACFRVSKTKKIWFLSSGLIFHFQSQRNVKAPRSIRMLSVLLPPAENCNKAAFGDRQPLLKTQSLSVVCSGREPGQSLLRPLIQDPRPGHREKRVLLSSTWTPHFLTDWEWAWEWGPL